ncbi:hypothetical protein [Paracoccus beibuensis]|uniref:hypothetical protein n=1 Tax=Paracoccus beibuensis TaxID=547602 RepID=UPI00223FA860|nr:hypothetical protein [Paracoccus beibuensis]
MAQKTYAERLRELTYAERVRLDGKFPAVLRFASLSPKDVAGMIAHAERRIGDVSHCDPSRKHLNRVLVGDNSIADIVRLEELRMKNANHLSNIKGTKKKRGKKAAAAVMNAGPQNPWTENAKSGPPLREFVLTVHRDKFRAADDCPAEHVLEFLDDEGRLARFDKRKCEEFTQAGLGFMQNEFGSMLKYCRVDFDEQSIHLQGLIYDIIEEPASDRYADGRKLFRSAHHPLIGGEEIPIEGKVDKDGNPVTWRKKGYEIAQDAVGAWFQSPEHQHMNIVRAEPRAAALREAKKYADKALIEVQGDEFLDGADSIIPPGSPRAQMMFALRKRIEEEAAAKGGDASKIRTHQASQIALDILLTLGVVTHETRDGARTRGEMNALLKPFEERFGSAKDMVADPDAVIAKLAAEAAIERARQNEAAALRRAEEDRQAAAERARLDREAEARRKAADEAAKAAREVKQKELDDRDAELDKRAEKLAEKETALKKLARELGAWRDTLLSYAADITAAARRVELLKDPVVSAGLKNVAEVEKMGKPRGFEIDD